MPLSNKKKPTLKGWYIFKINQHRSLRWKQGVSVLVPFSERVASLIPQFFCASLTKIVMVPFGQESSRVGNLSKQG